MNTLLHLYFRQQTMPTLNPHRTKISLSKHSVTYWSNPP